MIADLMLTILFPSRLFFLSISLFLSFYLWFTLSPFFFSTELRKFSISSTVYWLLIVGFILCSAAYYLITFFLVVRLSITFWLLVRVLIALSDLQLSTFNRDFYGSYGYRSAIDWTMSCSAATLLSWYSTCFPWLLRKSGLEDSRARRYFFELCWLPFSEL